MIMSTTSWAATELTECLQDNTTTYLHILHLQWSKTDSFVSSFKNIQVQLSGAHNNKLFNSAKDHVTICSPLRDKNIRINITFWDRREMSARDKPLFMPTTKLDIIDHMKWDFLISKRRRFYISLFPWLPKTFQLKIESISSISSNFDKELSFI